MSVHVLDDDNFEKEVLKSNQTVLVDFYADWCGPCKMQAPIIDEISNEQKEVKVGKVNIDENPKIAEKFGIMSIPTLIIFKDGEITNKFIGITSKENIIKSL